jgi:hypothetical protein
VISVSGDVPTWADLSATAGEIRKQIAASPIELVGQPCPAQVCGSSRLWNAIYDAARLKLRPLTGNKALLILTDGFDSGSTHTRHRAVDEAQKADNERLSARVRHDVRVEVTRPDLTVRARKTYFQDSR